MSSEQNWEYPDWIHAAKHKLRNIDTSKFLFPVYIEHEIISPKNNKYVPLWAVAIKIYIDAKDRIKGKNTKILSSAEGIYVYRSSDIEDVIFEELTSLIDHELKECFQIRERAGVDAKIPFDPHKTNKYTTLYSYNKVKMFPHYPSLKSYVWVMTKRLFKFIGKKLATWVKSTKTLTPNAAAATIDSGITVTEPK